VEEAKTGEIVAVMGLKETTTGDTLCDRGHPVLRGDERHGHGWGDILVAADTAKTSEVLLLYALALFAYSGVKILVPTFYALNDTGTPVRLSITTVIIKITI
jgi:hypothetical protein